VAATFAAAALGLLCAAELAASLARAALVRLPAAGHALAGMVDSVLRAGTHGRDPGAAERRRLLACGAALAFTVGAIAAGPAVGLAAGAAGPWAVARVLRARREHYRRAVDSGAADMAVAVADAIGGGHSLGGALAEAATTVTGPAGQELRRVAADVAAGSRTDTALEDLRRRTGSPRIETLVAACLLQRRAGGDLARLLRECAGAFEDQTHLEAEVRAATAQARFTGLLVVILPLGGAALAELASPGFLPGLWSSFVTAWLVGIALGLQLAAGLLIRRLGRVRW
jgi:tight adherence protein B